MTARDVTRRGRSGLSWTAAGPTLALTVYGPLGAVDLVVPVEAVANDVAREYAVQAGLPAIPLVYTELGELLPADSPLLDAGIEEGDVLVASTSVHRTPSTSSAVVAPESQHGDGLLAALVLCVAAGVAALGGWFAARAAQADGSARLPGLAIALLVAGAAVGVLPVGALRSVRVLAAPAFAGAGAFAALAETGQEKLPLVLGICALAAAVTAAAGRALDSGTDAAARVWIVAGCAFFVLTSLAALADLPPRVTWSVVLVLAMLSARVVPSLAIDVPDAYLIDLDRLAVTAWSARERPRTRRGRIVVPEAAVVAVAARGSAIVAASAAAVLLLSALSAPLLLAAAELPVDRIGARVLVLLCGAALLLGARSHRHTVARQLLRAAGLACWAALAAALVPVLSDGQWLAVAIVAVGVATSMVLVAVATGRGWRSAWWSRRAEVAEACCGSLAIAAVVVAAGFFRILWEVAS